MQIKSEARLMAIKNQNSQIGIYTDLASPWYVFFVASIAVFLVSIDGTILFAAFAALGQGFPNSTAAELSWVLNAYTVVYAALLVPAGRLVDAYGRKRVFQLGVCLFLMASVVCGASSTLGVLIAARVLQAVGASLLTPASLALVLGAFPTDRRAIVVSLWGAVGGLAAALGPSLGAAIVDTMGWRWAFYLNLPFGLIAWWYGRQKLIEWRDNSAKNQLDAVGIAILMAGIGALAYGIVETGTSGWGAQNVIGASLSGLLLLVIFVVWEKYSQSPAINLSIFSDRSYSYTNLATLTFSIGFSMMFFAMFFFLMKIWHYSLSKAGLAVFLGPALVVPVAMIAGRLAARIGHRPLLIAGSLLYAAGGLWLYLRISNTPDYLGVWLPGLLMTGTAVGMVLPSLGAAAVAKLPPKLFGVGSAINQAIRQIGSVLGVAITVALVGHINPQISDFRNLHLTYIVLALATAMLCLGVNTIPARR